MLGKKILNIWYYRTDKQKRRLTIWCVYLRSLVHSILPLRTQYSISYDFHGPVTRRYVLDYLLVYYRRRYFFSFYYVIVWYLYVIVFLVWYTLLLQLLVVFWNLNKRLVLSIYWTFIYFLHRYNLHYYWIRRGYYLYTLKMYIKRKFFYVETETPLAFLFSNRLWVLSC